MCDTISLFSAVRLRFLKISLVLYIYTPSVQGEIIKNTRDEASASHLCGKFHFFLLQYQVIYRWWILFLAMSTCCSPLYNMRLLFCYPTQCPFAFIYTTTMRAIRYSPLTKRDRKNGRMASGQPALLSLLFSVAAAMLPKRHGRFNG